ncbi:MAG: patatin-like phospholipase family protein [Deltaproteobacteria bacterium]|nr:patatin-like phospholipase family protein [Deltaproteobacteria bacterium]
MGITIVQKSDLTVVKPWAKKALILSGGAVTGGSFKTGGVKALNDFFANFTVNDFDIYVGVSSGSLLAVPLAAGLTPEEILRSLDGSSRHFLQLAPWHFYWPNYRECITRPVRWCFDALGFLPRAAWNLLKGWRESSPELVSRLWRVIQAPTTHHYTELWNLVTSMVTLPTDGPSWLQLLPTGLFDNAPIERYLRRNIERNHLTNNFQVVEQLRQKQLYICAMTLDGANRVVFGPDECHDVTISEAVQASTAMPVFYKPARIRGIDYVDGGCFETAHIDVSVAKGAELIVCYNPFRPVENTVFWEYIQRDHRYVTHGRPLSTNGISAVLNQIFRAIFHTRLHQTIRNYRQSETFKGDIILIEPYASDMAFFELNPFIYRHRIKAARIGFESVRNSIDKRYAEIEAILKSYGIALTRQKIEADSTQLDHAGKNSVAMQKILEGIP